MTAALAAGFHPELALLEGGHKRIVKIERVPWAQREERAAGLRERGLAATWRDDRRYGWGGADDEAAGRSFTTIVAGPDPADVHRGLDCDLLEAGEAPLDERLDASREIGALLGYPPCCVQAYLDSVADPRWNPRGDLGHVVPLNRTTGPLDPHCNRIGPGLPLLSHHPCRLDCASSVRLGRAVLAALRVLSAAAADRVWADLQQPCLWFGEAATLVFDGVWRGDVYRYTDVRSADLRGGGHAELLEAAQGCDGLGVGLGAAQLLRGDGAVADLGALGGPAPRWFDWSGARAPWHRAPAAVAPEPLATLLRAQGLRAHSGDPAPDELVLPGDLSLRAALDALARHFGARPAPRPSAPRRIGGDPSPPPPTADPSQGPGPRRGSAPVLSIPPGLSSSLESAGFALRSLAPMGAAVRLVIEDPSGPLAFRVGPPDARGRFRCGALTLTYERSDRPFADIERAAEALAEALEAALEGGTEAALQRWIAGAATGG